VEASEEKRAEYLKTIESIPLEDLVYIDESGIEMNMCKDRGWGKKGQILPDKKSGKHYEKKNIVAGLCANESVAAFVFNGSCNTELFESWVEQFLVQELKPGQVVIMDNASFHKSQKTRQLIESAGCRLIFLPPYSPDLNPIEQFWANMKKWIKNKISEFGELYKTICAFFAVP
jgi:transposase